MSLATLQGVLATIVVQNFNIMAMFREATWPVRFVLFLLLSASVVSVAIIIRKWLLLKAAKRRGEAFLDEFDRSNDLKIFFHFVQKTPQNPFRELFMAGHREFLRLKEITPKPDQAVVSEALHRVLRKTDTRCTFRFESRLIFLATTGATAPFIGLFGTVWGIMHSFYQIGQTGASSLAVVAPGISEALTATAVGLFAAIPAVIFYNFFARRIRHLKMKMAEFREDLVARLLAAKP